MFRRHYFTATFLVPLPERDSGVMNSIVRVHPSRVDAQKRTKGKIFRREPLLLRNTANGLSTVRFAMGAGAMAIRSPNCIAIDHDTADALGIAGFTGGSKYEIAVESASYRQVVGYFMRHPDWGYRVATHLGLGGLAFGILGAILGITSFF